MAFTDLSAPPTVQMPAVEAGGFLTMPWLQFLFALWRRGLWTPVKFDASDFTASGSMTWTVEEADQVTFAYTLIGKTLLVAFSLASTAIGGVASGTLQIAIPADFTAARTTYAVVYLNNNATWQTAIANVSAAAGTVINITKVDGSNFATGATSVYGQIAFEVKG
jgi:hypothetical protein